MRKSRPPNPAALALYVRWTKEVCLFFPAFFLETDPGGGRQKGTGPNFARGGEIHSSPLLGLRERLFLVEGASPDVSETDGGIVILQEE